MPAGFPNAWAVLFAAFLLSFVAFPIVVVMVAAKHRLEKRFPRVPALAWLWLVTFLGLLLAGLVGWAYAQSGLWNG